MIVPDFWAEARIQQRLPDRQITVRRFGWSCVSQEAAEAHAGQRVREAFERAVAGEKLERRERRVAYNGADGVPIREEVISRHGENVITRNAYGALCLNTPDVMFVDVDQHDGSVHGCGRVFLVLLVAGVWFCITQKLWLGILAAVPAAGILAAVLCILTKRLWIGLRGGEEAIARRRVERFANSPAAGLVRVYRTPAGFRLLLMHRTFDSRSPEADAIFRELRADPVYVRMCKAQHCFRARLTPKPWRIGMKKNFRPRRAAWPVKEEYLPERREWVEQYVQLSTGFAACSLVGEYGAQPPCPQAVLIAELHDTLCRAKENLPVA